MATSWTDTSAGSATTSNDAVWGHWIDLTLTSASTTETIWVQWVSGTTSGSGSIQYADGGVFTPAPPETEEQREARQAQYRQHEEELEAARLKREAAKQKAKELLRESLDKKQREQFDKTKWFFVISQSGKQFRVRHGWAGNIDEINQEDMIVASYCIHPSKSIPIEDSMLIQKLMLEIDEERFMQIANKTPFRVPTAV